MEVRWHWPAKQAPAGPALPISRVIWDIRVVRIIRVIMVIRVAGNIRVSIAQIVRLNVKSLNELFPQNLSE